MAQIETLEVVSDDAGELDPRAALAAAMPGGGASMAEAARAAGVGRSTLYRWADTDPHFVAEWNCQRQEYSAAIRRKSFGICTSTRLRRFPTQWVQTRRLPSGCVPGWLSSKPSASVRPRKLGRFNPRTWRSECGSEMFRGINLKDWKSSGGWA